MARAATAREAREASAELLSALGTRFDRAPLILADLSAGVPGPGGAVTDLRTLRGVALALHAQTGLAPRIADGLPTPEHGPAPSLFRRARVDRLAVHLGAGLTDLARGPQASVTIAGERVRIAQAAMDAALVVVPTVRVDGLHGLAAASVCLLGAVHPADRARLVRRGPEALVGLARILDPALTVASALVVQEGSEPRMGLRPRRFGRLVAGGDPLLVDLALGRLLGMTAEEIPALWWAIRAGVVSAGDFALVEETIPVALDLRKPLAPAFDRLRALPSMPSLPSLADARALLTAGQGPSAAEDTLGAPRRDAARCGDCRRCEEFCPTELSREEIGTAPAGSRCIDCLYCVVVCPRGALELPGDPGPLARALEAEQARLAEL